MRYNGRFKSKAKSEQNSIIKMNLSILRSHFEAKATEILVGCAAQDDHGYPNIYKVIV